jgi:hypothetical protein
MKTKFCLAVISALLFCSNSAAAAILYVNSDGSCGGQSPCFAHIQDAINASVAGDTVQVAAGTYIENINLKSGVIVQGAGANVTTIKAALAGTSVVTAFSSSSSTKFDGFTVTGGNTDRGAGIYVLWYSVLTISNVVITGNQASLAGGGIEIFESDPVISNATITNNSAGQAGGAIINVDASPTITNSNISNNSAIYGGGIFNGIGSFPTILNTAFTGNTATYGGGLYNSLTGNLPGVSIINSTITGNYASYGGGIYNYNGSIPGGFIVASFTLLNAIVSSNQNGGIYCQIADTNEVTILIDNNDVWNNSGGDYLNVNLGIFHNPTCLPGPHDISADPMFVDAANGNYRLKPESACIDKGNNDAVPSFLTTDFYGNPRIIDGDGNGIATVDIGIAEFSDVATEIHVPTEAESLQDTVTLQASGTGASSVSFSIRAPGGASGIPIGFGDMPASFNSVSGYWELAFDTTQLSDGYYIIFSKAVGGSGDIVTSNIVNFSIRNWSEITLLPATSNNNAGRTMPIKFSIVISASVDPSQPFVHNEDIEIRIFDVAHPGDILQISHFGTKSTDYRIDDATKLYITNFRTAKTPATYTVEILRNGFLIGSFNFSTF